MLSLNYIDPRNAISLIITDIARNSTTKKVDFNKFSSVETKKTLNETTLGNLFCWFLKL